LQDWGLLLNGRWEVVRRLGSGGMGEVHLARDLHESGRPVALKILHADHVDAESLEHFRDEFRSLSHLRHPNLVEVYDFGSVAGSGEPFLALELVEGRSLDALSAAEQRRGFVAIASQCLRALDAIHECGWLHNDLKPQNILVAPPLHLRLVDFGLAQKLASAEWVAPSGTLHYLAPERLRAGIPDRRSDLYSLGVVLYECLTGTRPFEGRRSGELVGAILDQTPPAPKALFPDIPEAWDALVRHLMARSPDDRPASAEEALALLNAGSTTPLLRDTDETFAARIRSAPLVGREREVTALRDAVRAHREAKAAAVRVVLISGPAGSGKSRLADETRRDAQLASIRTLSGRAHEAGGASLQPLHEILTTALHAGRVPESARPALDQMLGHLQATRAGGHAAASRPSGALSRQEAISGVAQVLDRLAEGEPGVLFLEDLQCATPPALSLVEHLVARQAASPWLIIATVRDDEARGAWRRLLGRPGVHHLELPPLDAAGTLRLVQAMLSFATPPQALAAWLAARSGGRPLHVIESLKQMFALGRLQHLGDHWAVTDAAEAAGSAAAAGALADMSALLDTAAGELFWARFAALPPTELEAARMLAVFGRPVAVTTLADALGRVSARRAAARTAQAVETLARLGLVVLDQDLDGSRTASLAQKSARDEVYRRLPPIRRRALHGAALLALEGIGSGFAEERCEDLARHAEAAGDVERAEKYLLASAARARAAFDPVAESAYLSRALDYLPRRDERRLPILGRVVELVTSAIADHKAGGRLSRQLAREARGARSRRYEIMGLRSEAWTRAFLGDESGARLLLAKAIRLARETDDTSELVNALMYLASVLSRGHRNSEVQPYLDEAIGLARRDDDPTPLMVLLATEGLNRLVAGDAAASIASFEEALHVAERRERRASYYSVLGNLGMAHLDLGELSRARDYITRGLDWSREHALVNHCIEQTRSLAWLNMLNGRYDRAAALAVETRRWLEVAGRTLEPTDYDWAGRLDLGLGRFGQARAVLVEGLEAARRSGDTAQVIYLLVSASESALALGDVATARREAAEALGLAQKNMHDRGVFLAHRALVRAGLDDGEDARAVPAGAALRVGTHLEAIAALSEEGMRFSDRADRDLLLAEGLWLSGAAGAKAASRARALAERAARAGFREHAWRAWALAGRAFADTALHAEAVHAYHEAVATVRAVSEEFEDPDMKDDYLKHPDRTALARLAAEAQKPAPEPHPTAEATRPVATEAAHPTGAARSAPTYSTTSPHQPATGTGASVVAERTLATLFEITQVINTIRDPEELLDTVMDLAIQNVGAERGLIFLFDDEGKEMQPVVARNVEKQTIKDATTLSRTILRQAGLGRAILSHDAGRDQRFKDYRSVARYHIRSLMCVPLVLRGRTLGTVYVDTRAPGVVFDREHLKFLEAFASQAAVAVENARQFDRVQKENETLKQAVQERFGFENMVGRSPRIKEVYDLLARVAPSNLSVLIRGESGTGKELVARAIHQNSPRRDRPFCAENCAAIPETLLESELFGYMRGAFTGADTARRGLFETADGGTIFLDEIGDMSMTMQSKLLRVLQNGEIRPLGSDSVKRVNVRVISATNRPLEEMIRKREFREDLYYRLRGISVALPPLRERRDDIPLLVDHFLGMLAKQNDAPKLRVEPALLLLLTRRPWPGNVRELENAIYRLALFAAKGVITAEAAHKDFELLDAEARQAAAPHRSAPGRTDLKKGDLRRALAEAKGNRDEAARLLGVSRATLFRKLRSYGLINGSGREDVSIA
jgi:Nif-specific regulatory protein